MRLPTIIQALLISMTCCSNDNYEDLLAVRLKEIEELQLFDNSFVVYSEIEGYGSTFPRWESNMDYYQDDMVIDNSGKMYRAIMDSKGKDPKTYRNEWKLIPWKHPYLFLRDTAKTEDLRKLLTNKHPSIKTYAFAALANKDFKGLFNIIMDNLGDTTRITQTTSDYGFDVCPADLMISYKLGDLTKEERDRLRKLIETKYNYLTYAKKLLEDK